jgi:tRNA G10  N-methylase Trm11
LLGALKAGFKKNRQKALLKRGTKRKQRNRFVTNPSEIEAWRLLENKTDFCIAKTPDGFLFCQTIAVSRPEQWKWRDENRPVKDNKEIVSIRLAKILVNLAGLKEGQTVLDPFCGYGTILQEALLHGLNGIGIEKDAPKAQACRRNLEWAQKEFRVHGKITIHNADAVQLERVLEKNAFDAVVTEPYLGPYLNKKPSHEKAQRIMNELRSLYQQFFSVLVNCMNSGQRVVFIFPLFEFPGGERLRLPETVFSTWFVNVNPLQGMGSEWKNAFPFPYQNPNNKLAREIRVLQRK